MKAHGTYTISPLGKAVLVKASGPSNHIAVRNYAGDIEAIWEKMLLPSWGLCGIVTGEALFTPEAELELLRTTRRHMTLGMSRVAIVYEGIKEPHILRAQLERIYNRAGIPLRFFKSQSQALAWLEQAD